MPADIVGSDIVGSRALLSADAKSSSEAWSDAGTCAAPKVPFDVGSRAWSEA